MLFLLVPRPWDHEGGGGAESCIERFELVTGDGILDWDVGWYFLNGLEHFQNGRNTQCDPFGEADAEYQ